MTGQCGGPVTHVLRRNVRTWLNAGLQFDGGPTFKRTADTSMRVSALGEAGHDFLVWLLANSSRLQFFRTDVGNVDLCQFSRSAFLDFLRHFHQFGGFDFCNGSGTNLGEYISF